MATLNIDRETIRRFCQEHYIREMSLFGSVLRDDFRPDSDVDVLIEFLPGARVTLLDLVRIRNRLSEIIGHQADVVTKKSLSRHIRDRVLSSREVLYVAAG